jgi:hypothetical protein
MPSKKKKKSSPRKAKKSATHKRPAKTAAAQKTAASKRMARTKSRKKKKHRARGKSEEVNTVLFEPKGLGALSAGQSGDLQGLSNLAGADSESVGELLEEGNAFEAELVKAVQEVPDADQAEIRTREVPEDDVPEEYLESEP